VLTWLQALGPVVLLLGVLYGLLYVLARRVFNLNLWSLKSLVRHNAAARSAAPAGRARHQYRLCPTESTYPPLPLDVLRLDCRTLGPGPETPAPRKPRARGAGRLANAGGGAPGPRHRP